MILISLLVTHLILASAKLCSDVDYCEVNDKLDAEEIAANYYNKRLLFYDVNPPEGFNLRRDVYMRFAIMLAAARKTGITNWALVLPPWQKLYHWTMDDGRPKPWSTFFDVDSLKSFAPVVEMHEILNRSKTEVLEIDTLYILSHFPNAFEDGAFVQKWAIDTECDSSKKFWSYDNIKPKQVICVKFQGLITKLWEVIAMHASDKKVMFTHGEIPLHDGYGTQTYWDCRKSMKFNKNLVERAKQYIAEYLNCDTDKCETYVSVHWRRQDFARGRGDEVPSIIGTAKQIRKILKKLNIQQVFVATDASMMELTDLEKKLTSWGYQTHIFIGDPTLITEYRDGGVAIIDQIICSHAAFFIGTHESTFTYRIQEEREILGFDSETTFNRLCPDVGRCDKPSKWTIIN